MPSTSANSVIDVLDPVTGAPTGLASKAEAFERALAVRTVHVLLTDDRRRLLLQQLGRDRDRHQLLWGSSVAAFPRPGEPSDEAARRRLAEELGLELPLRQLGTVQMVDGRSPKFIAVYGGTVDATPKVLEIGHVERVEFWSPSDIDTALELEPEQFTDTFRQVYRWWCDRTEP